LASIHRTIFFTSRIPIKYTSTAHQFIYFGRNSCTHGCVSYGRDMLITFVSICPSFVDPPPRCRILPAPTVERAVGLLARFGYEPATVRSGAGAFLNHEGPCIYSSGKDSQAPHQQLGCLLQYLSSSCFILPCVHQQEGMTVGDGGEKKGGSGCPPPLWPPKTLPPHMPPKTLRSNNPVGGVKEGTVWGAAAAGGRGVGPPVGPLLPVSAVQRLRHSRPALPHAQGDRCGGSSR